MACPPNALQLPFPRAETALFLEGNHLHVSHSLEFPKPPPSRQTLSLTENPQERLRKTVASVAQQHCLGCYKRRGFSKTVFLSFCITVQKLSLSSAFSLKERIIQTAFPIKSTPEEVLVTWYLWKRKEAGIQALERGLHAALPSASFISKLHTFQATLPFFLEGLLPLTNEFDFPRQCLLKLLWSLLANAFYFFISFIPTCASYLV